MKVFLRHTESSPWLLAALGVALYFGMFTMVTLLMVYNLPFGLAAFLGVAMLLGAAICWGVALFCSIKRLRHSGFSFRYALTALLTLLALMGLVWNLSTSPQLDISELTDSYSGELYSAQYQSVNVN
ncbi:hypothetical protein G3R49_01270 [Shewanella sp. WXL01]|uniref:Uncharacterized protein n=1 Tax=Shewanella maritima TaxID=2520507 RepID=A0A411PGQ5_9GAMM|nr:MULTISPECIES: hypothetical protein [Shewanella]NKF49207.1 hypothetical protein [Shewanella sp. WXL01]QBF82678.1 hypothetical protein EXU30_08230 [Shewanella maritima]